MSRICLLVALGVDNAGSGLFLPLTLVYVTRVVGLPLGTAGPTVAAGTLAGLLVPPLAGPFVDRVGPRPVVITSQLVQAVGTGAFLVADGVLTVALATVTLAAGQQLFYSSLFALLSDVAGDGPKDRPFAVVAMVRAGCFGLGALAAGVLLATAGNGGLRVAVLANAASFAVCALMLASLVRPGHHPVPAGRPARPRVDRRFLSLVAITGLFALSVDFYLVGTPVYVLEVLHGQPWLPGVSLAVSTTINATCATLALRATRRITRVAAMGTGAVLAIAWCAASLVALAVPAGWLPPVLLAATLVIATSGLLFGTRANALAAELAPAVARGRYLAMFQYAFTVPGVLAPGVAGLFTVASWLPWLVVAACATAAAAGLRRFA